MKKNLFIAIAAAGMLYSCGGAASGEEITKGANDICACMTAKAAERAEMSPELLESTINFDYTMCAFDAAMNGIDPASDEFTAAVGENCPELKEAQAAYVKTANEK